MHRSWHLPFIALGLTTASLPAGEIASAFAHFRLDETELLKHEHIRLVAQNAAFTLYRGPRATEYALLRSAEPTADRGPGIHSWGGFGDSGKLANTSLLTVWAYAHFTGDWELIKERWKFVRAQYNTDLVGEDWLSFCRHSHAEWGDIGPPSIALARMAWKVGDVDTYHYASFLAARQLVGHFATLHGGSYFRENGPYRSEERMPETVFLSHQHHGAGWFVNGPDFVPAGQPPEEQWRNHFVRFACPDTGRFYQHAMNQRMRTYLTDRQVRSSLATALKEESHILPSFLRLWGLCTTAPQAEVDRQASWENWSSWDHRGSYNIGGNYAILLSKKKVPPIRIVVKKLRPGLSEIEVGQIRRIDIIAVKWNPWE